MDSEIEISKQTPTVKKTKLTWEAQLSMTTMFGTFALIPFIPMMGFSIIIFSGLISILCYIGWETSKKHSNDN
jgi:hypothetical protein